jgi:hypothetical protein
MSVYAIQPTRLVEDMPIEALAWTKEQASEWLDAEIGAMPFGADDEWYIDGNFFFHFNEWKERVHRRIEDRLRKDPQALLECAKALQVSLA